MAVPFRFQSRLGYEFSGFSHGRPHVTLCPVVSWYDGTDGFCLLLVASRETTLSRVVIRKGFRKPQVVGSIPIAGSNITTGCKVISRAIPAVATSLLPPSTSSSRSTAALLPMGSHLP